MAGWDGLGSAPQKLDLQMPDRVSVELTNPSQLQRPGSPISSWSGKVLAELGGTP